jgi:hypothetical protein
MPTTALHPARRLAAVLEPVAGQVYFARECHEGYEKLGFAGSPGDMNGVPLPDGPAYMCSRGSILGQVPGELVAAAFAVFNPAAVVPAVGVLSELYWGLPTRSYVRSRAWSSADLDAAEERLERRGLMAGGALTTEGRARREAVEKATDAQCAPIVAALEDDLTELVEILTPWGAAIRAGGGYPAAGPHDLAAHVP